MTSSDRVTFSMILTQLLSKAMAGKQLSQKEFLARSGISQATWSRMTRGQSSFSLEDLRSACKVLSIDCACVIKEAEAVEAKLPTMDVAVVPPVGPSEAPKYAGMFIAAAALAFLISRILKK